MFMENRAMLMKQMNSSVLLRDLCVGCKDCKGPCLILLQLLQVPDLVTKSGDVDE